MKRIFIAFTALFIIAFAACKKNNTPAPTTANVMFMNGCSGATSVDVSSGINKVAGATNIAFEKNSGYKSLNAGTDSMAFILSSLGTPLKTSTQSLTAGNSYSAFLGGIITNPTFIFLNDDLSSPPSGYAKIRFVNLTTDDSLMTAYAGATVIASNVGYQGYTSFMQVPAGPYVIKAGETNNIGTVVATGTQQLGSGNIYTVVMTGTVNGSGSSAFAITIITNK